MIKPVHDESDVIIYHSHSLLVLMGMASDSVDSIVTDPPYGLKFMGKQWDYDVPSVQLWREALRVLKPGGHLLSFAGSRTYHRMAVNIEDAGFEIRDQIMWIYGSGFPKSHDVSKAIDKAAGVKREVIGKHEAPAKSIYTQGQDELSSDVNITAPATPEAQQWDGWGTALKPAHEPIVVARKPITGTVAENVLKHGTGGINIDGGRIGTEEDCARSKSMVADTAAPMGKGIEMGGNGHELGRFPANIILDAEAGAMLDKQSGCSVSVKSDVCNKGSIWGSENDDIFERGHNDSGGASRFFYCAKASKEDRDEGLEGMAYSKYSMSGNDSDRDNDIGLNKSIERRNSHPTVKPTALMQYLVRLVTPPDGIVLDPFMGSGSTGKGAVRERFKFIGIEREAEYIPISIARINAPAQVTLL